MESGLGYRRSLARGPRPQEYVFLDEHRIDGTPVLPGTGQLDLLVRALAETYPDTAGRAVRLREVVLRHPLVVTGSRRVTIAFEWPGRMDVHPRFAGGGQAANPIVHATGQADTEAGPAAPVEPGLGPGASN